MDAPTPKNILRGHKTQVHSARFIRRNSRLVTGDSEGFVILWDLATMRPTAVWQAHTKPVLAVQDWGPERLITQLAEADEIALSKEPPLNALPELRPKPWVEFVLPVNSMNFCAFSACDSNPLNTHTHDIGYASEIYLATPNALQLEGIDIFHIPSNSRKHTVKAADNAGMVMATALGYDAGLLTLAAGYENGQVTLSRRASDETTWSLVYTCTVHAQPVLSLQVSPDRTFFVTSGVDAVLAKHPIPTGPHSQVATAPLRVVNTKHAGQQGLDIRSDGKVLATGGWDSRGRVYSCKTLKELAVLKWHDVGCYAAGFATISPPQSRQATNMQKELGLLAQGNDESTSQKTEASSVRPAARSSLVSVRDRRIMQAREGHWLALGGKDGRVSLWDVF
ncbi:hypothetical protein TD95_004037 [Thielaviopsis punctulata]|uniref:ASTRA-associated protein 1 n=1 Tax=Thielaviopsis punctulata TaxID=72032 RepID=A0A0F4ZGN9_9PEZI|nr:hypothetical protein TD95_004037 [Thielaviopsis punctulata]